MKKSPVLSTEDSHLFMRTESQNEVPNITGNSWDMLLAVGGNYGVSGFILNKQSSLPNEMASINVSGNRRVTNIEMDASVHNATYGGSKLQPSALQLLACIRC